MSARTADPLVPLTANEIRVTTRVVAGSQDFPERARWVSVTLDEPTRDQQDDGQATRRARAALFDGKEVCLHEVVVDLGTEEVVDHRRRAGLQPGLGPEDQRLARELLAADPRWVQALRLRGIDDPGTVATETGPSGFFGEPREGKARLGRTIAFQRRRGERNYYAHPLPGLMALVDLTAGEVIDVVDQHPLPIPEEPGEFFGCEYGTRSDVKPLEIVQPEGPSFAVDGNRISWQKWRFRFVLDHIEGVVLHELRYQDGPRLRPLFRRVSLSEMVVPYGDPAPTQFWRSAFDASEAGVGRQANSLELGCDCLGHIHYFDAAFVTPDGEATTIRNAVCLHEEDSGIAWKHTDPEDGETVVRRMRRLVLSSIATMGNYDYGFYWYLYADGTIEHEVKLTGILYTGATDIKNPSRYGTQVAPGLYAPNHQHIFCYRIDPEVDGRANCVEEVDVIGGRRDQADPHGIAFRAVTTRLASERNSGRRVDSARARTWRICNRDSRNRMGDAVAYRLIPPPTATLLADPQSAVARAAPFAQQNLWVTAYNPQERYAAGAYPAFGDSGISEWVKADRPLVDTDVVLWHVFATTHVARSEDWPIMPVERTGFRLKPDGFFERNPAVDLPPSPHNDCSP